MYSDVPNLASAFGYTNASWTLKCDLTCEYVCRLLNHMDRTGLRQVHAAQRRPCHRARSRGSTSPPAMSSGRSRSCPSRARRRPWKLHQNYALDIAALRFGRWTTARWSSGVSDLGGALFETLYGIIAPPGQTAYAASKFAVPGLFPGAAA